MCVCTSVSPRASCAHGATLCVESWQEAHTQPCPLAWEVQRFPAARTSRLSHQGRRRRRTPEDIPKEKCKKFMSEIELVSISGCVCTSVFLYQVFLSFSSHGQRPVGDLIRCTGLSFQGHRGRRSPLLPLDHRPDGAAVVCGVYQRQGLRVRATYRANKIQHL